MGDLCQKPESIPRATHQEHRYLHGYSWNAEGELDISHLLGRQPPFLVQATETGRRPVKLINPRFCFSLLYLREELIERLAAVSGAGNHRELVGELGKKLYGISEDCAEELAYALDEGRWSLLSGAVLKDYTKIHELLQNNRLPVPTELQQLKDILESIELCSTV